MKSLNDHITIKHYDLSFDLDLERVEGKENKFLGKNSITFVCDSPCSEIILHSKKIVLTSIALIVKQQPIMIPLDTVKVDKEKDMLTIPFNSELAIGEHVLCLEFSGLITQEMAGLYKSAYKKKDGNDGWMATTQFEPAHAREAFPCIDEPAAKATFIVTLIVDASLEAISNTSVTRVEERDAKKIFYFKKTPIMSTYLVYLGAAEYESVEEVCDGKKIRILSQKGKQSLSQFGLEHTIKYLSFYEDYFGIPYPLDKLDMIAVPDFGSGAMENWGAITFREDAILLDPKTSSLNNQQRVTEVIAHELVHQWFGNLVTMEWWNDLWLNESFADYIAFKAMDHFNKELDPWGLYILMNANAGMRLDSLSTSHPIDVIVETPSQIREIFDSISYAKGGMILRMMNSYVGEEAFKKGLRKYLKENKYKNAQGTKLWEAIETVVKDKPVAELMKNWLNQTGYPVVSVRTKGPLLYLEQHIFRYLPDTNNTQLWCIPLDIITDKGEKKVFFKEKMMTIDMGVHSWVKVNAGQTGFYRVHYSKELLEKLLPLVASKTLNHFDRWGIQNDMYALMMRGDVSVKEYLSLLHYYQDEDEYLVLNDIIESLQGLLLVVSRESFLQYITGKVMPFYKHLHLRYGWDAKKGEKETDSILRSRIISSLGRLGDTMVLSRMKELFIKYLEGDTTIVHTDMRQTLYFLGALQGDRKTYDILKKKYEEEHNPQEQIKLLMSLGMFQQEDIIKEVFTYIFSDNVRQQNVIHVISVIGGNKKHYTKVWPWIKKQWGEIKKRYVGAEHHAGYMIGLQSILADMSIANELEQFMNTHAMQGTSNKVKQTIEKIRVNALFLERTRKEYA